MGLVRRTIRGLRNYALYYSTRNSSNPFAKGVNHYQYSYSCKRDVVVLLVFLES
jgi:hypothetical protein